jgi:hypothetical protein
MKTKGKWRVYAAKHPTKLDGTFEADHPKQMGWYWLGRGGDVGLKVRVQNIQNARFIARELNRAAAMPNVES